MSAAEAIQRFLESSDIPHERLSDSRWVAQLRGDRKLTIPLGIAVTGEQVVFESFFMRRPQENHERFYELLLRRNMRAQSVHFALDAQGDVYLLGRLPARALDQDDLDRVFGGLLIEADGMFDAAIEVGFATYLARDMAWREQVARATEAVAEPVTENSQNHSG